MLGYPIPNNYVARHFIIQEDVYGKLYNVRGFHGWDKSYLNLDSLDIKLICLEVLSC